MSNRWVEAPACLQVDTSAQRGGTGRAGLAFASRSPGANNQLGTPDTRPCLHSQVDPLIKGQVGTTINVGVLRPGASNTATVRLVRSPTGQKPQNAASLAKAKAKGLFKSHIEEKSVSVSLAAPIHENSGAPSQQSANLQTRC
jgi:hypothetical protein